MTTTGRLFRQANPWVTPTIAVKPAFVAKAMWSAQRWCVKTWATVAAPLSWRATAALSAWTAASTLMEMCGHLRLVVAALVRCVEGVGWRGGGGGGGTTALCA